MLNSIILLLSLFCFKPNSLNIHMYIDIRHHTRITRHPSVSIFLDDTVIFILFLWICSWNFLYFFLSVSIWVTVLMSFLSIPQLIFFFNFDFCSFILQQSCYVSHSTNFFTTLSVYNFQSKNEINELNTICRFDLKVIFTIEIVTWEYWINKTKKHTHTKSETKNSAAMT